MSFQVQSTSMLAVANHISYHIGGELKESCDIKEYFDVDINGDVSIAFSLHLMQIEDNTPQVVLLLSAPASQYENVLIPLANQLYVSRRAVCQEIVPRVSPDIRRMRCEMTNWYANDASNHVEKVYELLHYMRVQLIGITYDILMGNKG